MQLALQRGSSDNICILCVDLQLHLRLSAAIMVGAIDSPVGNAPRSSSSSGLICTQTNSEESGEKKRNTPTSTVRDTPGESFSKKRKTNKPETGTPGLTRRNSVRLSKK
jgi:hypothetical protein